MRLPVSGWASLLHRVTGVLLVLAMPAVLYVWQQSLTSAERFQDLASWLTSPLGRLASLLLAWLFIQHLLTGVRHLLLDLDIAIGRESSRASAVAAFVAAIVLTLFLIFAWQ